MATWGEFAAEAPELARLGEERFARTGLALVGTLRKDGSPRISPVEPFLADGHLFLGMLWRSRKALDLLRDPRCTVHSTVSDRAATEGEFSILGDASDVSRAQLGDIFRSAVAERLGSAPPEPSHVFAVAIRRALFIGWEGGGKRVLRWPS